MVNKIPEGPTQCPAEDMKEGGIGLSIRGRTKITQVDASGV